MKVRLLERELLKLGYHFVRNGKGSHPIDRSLQTHHTISGSGKKTRAIKVPLTKSRAVYFLIFLFFNVL